MAKLVDYRKLCDIELGRMSLSEVLKCAPNAAQKARKHKDGEGIGGRIVKASEVDRYSKFDDDELIYMFHSGGGVHLTVDNMVLCGNHRIEALKLKIARGECSIDLLNTVVPFCRHKQPLTSQEETHIVNAENLGAYRGNKNVSIINAKTPFSSTLAKPINNILVKHLKKLVPNGEIDALSIRLAVVINAKGDQPFNALSEVTGTEIRKGRSDEGAGIFGGEAPLTISKELASKYVGLVQEAAKELADVLICVKQGQEAGWKAKFGSHTTIYTILFAFALRQGFAGLSKVETGKVWRKVTRAVESDSNLMINLLRGFLTDPRCEDEILTYFYR